MLGDRAPPSARRYDAVTITYVENATRTAWGLYDLFFSKVALPTPGQLEISPLAARLVRQWSVSCPADLAFDEVLPSMVSLAEDVNPYVDPESATRFWRAVASSPCAGKLDAGRKRWLDLFEA